MSAWVEVTRGPVVESRHAIHVAVVHADRGLIASAGDPHLVTFVRSAIKMFQALPLVEDDVVGALGLTDEELALCTSSHSAEPVHVAAARRILAKAGADEHMLACGPQAPMDPAAAAVLDAADLPPGRIHNNCSGKHAGMLALARHHGWPAEDYHRLDHPVQQRVLRVLTTWMEVPAASMPIGIDGCGLPTFALPLERVARGCARFAVSGGPPARIVEAMTGHPLFVAGTGRLCTELMTVQPQVFAKVGAEGYYCAGVPKERLGIALKAVDGARRAVEPALLAVLHALGALSSDQLEALERFARPAVMNTRGEIVGGIRAAVRLKRHGRS